MVKSGVHLFTRASYLATDIYAILVKSVFESGLLKQKKPLKISDFYNYRVELEGIEPSSAQGNHTLSTCLFQPLIFEV